MADCKKCTNRNNDYCIFACENGESFKPITNYDCIISKTPEELAKWIAGYVLNLTYSAAEMATDAWLEWLKQEEDE